MELKLKIENDIYLITEMEGFGLYCRLRFAENINTYSVTKFYDPRFPNDSNYCFFQMFTYNQNDSFIFDKIKRIYNNTGKDCNINDLSKTKITDLMLLGAPILKLKTNNPDIIEITIKPENNKRLTLQFRNGFLEFYENFESEMICKITEKINTDDCKKYFDLKLKI